MKRLNRRDFLKYSLLTSGGLYLSACVSRGTPESGQVGSSPTAPSPTTTQAPPTVTPAPGNLKALWAAYDPLVNASQKIMDLYKQKTGIVTEMQTVPFADWYRAIQATAQQPEPPDIMLIDGPCVLNYALTGLLRPLDDVFSQKDMDDFLSGTVAASFYKDKFYGPATNESSQAIIYNKGIVDKYNLDLPTSLEDAWTWKTAREIFMEVQAKEREARGDDQFWSFYLGQGMLLGGGSYTGLTTVRSNGEPGSPTYQAIGEDGITSSGYINTPEAIEALQFIQDMYGKDEIIPMSDSVDFFFNEQVAFWLTTPVYISYLYALAPNIKWGVIPCPYHKTPIVHTDSYHLGVSAYSSRGEEAAKLVSFMTETENSLSMAREQFVIPQRASALEQYAEFQQEPLSIFVDTVKKWAQPRPLTPGYTEFDTVYTLALIDIAQGAPVKETIDEAASKIDTQLAKYKDWKNT